LRPVGRSASAQAGRGDLDERADLRDASAGSRVDEVNRHRRGRERREERDEPALSQVVGNLIRERAGDAGVGGGCVDRGFGDVHTQHRPHPDAPLASAPVTERPDLARRDRRRGDAAVAGELRRRPRTPVLAQVRGARDDDAPHRTERGRDERGVGHVRDADRDVHALLDEADDAVEEEEARADLGVGNEVRLDDRAHVASAEDQRRGHGEESLRRQRLLAGAALGVVEIGEHPPRHREVALAGLGELERPRRSPEHDRAEPLLDRRDRAGDRRGRAAERPSCGGQAAALHGDDESAKGVEAVQRLFIFCKNVFQVEALIFTLARTHAPQRGLTWETSRGSPSRRR
jgi:hypothetical protein